MDMTLVYNNPFHIELCARYHVTSITLFYVDFLNFFSVTFQFNFMFAHGINTAGVMLMYIDLYNRSL